ncbi:MAG: outer membrane protein transport protein [Bacteroidales bacterium]|nr:outer membrane protein transport protein [Bacteroidales bacterium]
MRRFLYLLACVGFCANVSAQDITGYDTDSTAIYNAYYNPENYSQAPVKGAQRRIDSNGPKITSNITMGTSFGGGISSQYIEPRLNYQATNRLQLQFGMGIMYSNINLRGLATEDISYQNMRALTNYYSASAQYQASERCRVYGSVVYASSRMMDNPSSPMRDKYMATVGATYNITKSLSIGFEVRQSNINPYYMYGMPCNSWGM